jgi:hypothetical protein
MSQPVHNILAAHGRQLHDDEHGQIVFLAVFGFAAFFALAGLVFNSGRVVTQKIATQNAADAAIISGTARIARGMNMVAANNVAMTEVLGLTVVLRALHTTWEQGKENTERFLATESVVCGAASLTGAGAAACYAYYRAVREYSLRYFDTHLRAFGQLITEATDPQRGMLWQYMHTLTIANTAISTTFPLQAAQEAQRIAQVNEAEGLQVVPPLPLLPVEDGTFSDLCHPTRLGSPSSYAPGRQRGYVPLLGNPYEYDKGPLLVFLDDANGPALQIAFALILQPSPLPDNTDEEFGRWCRTTTGTHYQATRRTPFPLLLRGEGRSTNHSVSARAALKQHLRYLGIAWQTHRSVFMPGAFTDPRGRICASAQALLYNATSFDLFTQDWRVKLVRADLVEEGGLATTLTASACGADAAAVLAGTSLTTH